MNVKAFGSPLQEQATYLTDAARNAQTEFAYHTHNSITYALKLPSEGADTRCLWHGLDIDVFECGFFNQEQYEADVGKYTREFGEG